MKEDGKMAGDEWIGPWVRWDQYPKSSRYLPSLTQTFAHSPHGPAPAIQLVLVQVDPSPSGVMKPYPQVKEQLLPYPDETSAVAPPIKRCNSHLFVSLHQQGWVGPLGRPDNAHVSVPQWPWAHETHLFCFS